MLQTATSQISNIVCDEDYDTDCYYSDVECPDNSQCNLYCNATQSCRNSNIDATKVESFNFQSIATNSAQNAEIHVSSLLPSINNNLNLEYANISTPRVYINCATQFSCQGSSITGTNIDSMVIIGGGAKSFRYADATISNMCWVEFQMSSGDNNRCWQAQFTFSSIEVIHMNSLGWNCFCSSSVGLTSVLFENTVIAVNGVVKSSSDIDACTQDSITLTNYNPRGFANSDIDITNIFTNYCTLDTLSPTNMPSTNPSDIPSYIPTSMPTDEPTPSPTENPTRAPTDIPTAAPTNNPSSAPTRTPSNNPTSNPTANPTSAPTQAPTQIPSKMPTDIPSSDPTKVPSLIPSAVPSHMPTMIPTFTELDYVHDVLVGK